MNESGLVHHCKANEVRNQVGRIHQVMENGGNRSHCRTGGSWRIGYDKRELCRQRNQGWERENQWLAGIETNKKTLDETKHVAKHLATKWTPSWSYQEIEAVERRSHVPSDGHCVILFQKKLSLVVNRESSWHSSTGSKKGFVSLRSLQYKDFLK